MLIAIHWQSESHLSTSNYKYSYSDASVRSHLNAINLPALHADNSQPSVTWSSGLIVDLDVCFAEDI